MCEELLDAECVIRHLCNLNIIIPSSWKDSNTCDHIYPQHFDNPKASGIITLNIIKRNEMYFVPCSRIKILSYRHAFKTDNIYL